MSWFDDLAKFPSETQGPGPLPIPRTHSLPYADANDAEVRVNAEFFSKIEEMFTPKTMVALGLAIDALVDFILEGRRCERLEERGPTIKTTGIDFTIKDINSHARTILATATH
jgi:hypothetical protein